MSDIKLLVKELKNIIANTGTPVVARAAQITDDIAMRYADLEESNISFAQVVAMAEKIKASGAIDWENGVMWGEVIRLVHSIANAKQA